jgi:hypothetical protein
VTVIRVSSCVNLTRRTRVAALLIDNAGLGVGTANRRADIAYGFGVSLPDATLASP